MADNSGSKLNPKSVRKKDGGTTSALTSFTKTQVDLGDDLLEKTITQAASPLERATTPESLRDAVEDQLQSAKILNSEGLTEEAKRILRQILIADPGSVVARAMLADIHKAELKQIFSPSPERRRFRAEEAPHEDLARIDAEELMRGLDADLNLGVYAPDGGETLGLWQRLFKDQASMDRYAGMLERHLVDATLQDRLDLGISFLEMGLPELALRQFGLVVRRLAAQDPDSDEGEQVDENAPMLRLVSTCLLAQAQIQAGKPYDATQSIQPCLQAGDIPREEKIELIYLMALANERMERSDQAMAWYHQALIIDPGYRDVQERISLLQMRAARDEGGPS